MKHYGRLFPHEEKYRPADEVLVALADRMLEFGDSDARASTVPPGYTYLGQFIIHDLSREGALPPIGPLDPATVENLREPRLDLDSLYGGGPDLASAFYQKDGVRMRVGFSDWAYGEDLYRPPSAPGQPRRALIGDPRNDENLIVAQLHLAFIKFHNRVVDVIESQEGKGLAPRELFWLAAASVRRHYQWMVVHDFLRRMVGEDAVQEALRAGDRLFAPSRPPFIPVEFSVGAFRFGHSMVRSDYMLQRYFRWPFLSPDPRQQDLRGMRERPPGTLITHWEDFFTLDAQPARKIDVLVTAALGAVPAELAGGRPGDPPLSMPLADLRKGARYGLPSGQAAARALHVPQDQMLKPEDFSELMAPGVPGAVAELAAKTPLSYYCLKEAEHFRDGSGLGPVGGRIVASVLIGLLRSDPESYVSAGPGWRPEARFGAQPSTDRHGRSGVTFGMPELLAFATSADG
jgi:hypothetical protein